MHTVRHGVRFIRVWLAAGVVSALALAGLLVVALSDGPLVLPSWVARQIEAQLNLGLPAGHISLGRVEIELAAGDRSTLRLRDVGLRDGSGALVARLNEVDADLSLPALLRGRIVPRRFALAGAQVTLRRRMDGSLDVSFGAVAGIGGSVSDLIDRIDALFASGPLRGLERIEASDVTLSLEDARTGRLWQLTDSRLLLRQQPTVLRLELEAELFNGTEQLAPLSISIESRKDSGAATIDASLEGIAAADVALQSPALAFLSAVDAPLDGQVRLQIDPDGAISRLSAGLRLGSGSLAAVSSDAPLRLDGGEVLLSYDPAQQELGFDRLRLLTDRADIDLRGRAWLDDFGADGWPGGFEGQFDLNLVAARDTGFLAEPVRFDRGQAELRLRLAPLRLDIGRLTLGEGAETIELSGHATMTAAGPDLALDLTADRISAERALALWPPRIGAAARTWVSANVAAGELSRVRLAMRRGPGETRARLLLGFDFSGAAFSGLKTEPPVESTRGYASLADNRFDVVLEQGQVQAPQGGSLQLAGSRFTVADTTKHPPDAEIALHVDGPLPALLSVLDRPPFLAMQRAGQPVDLATGTANGTALVRLPLRRGLTPGQIIWSAQASLGSVRSDRLVPGRELAADRLELQTDSHELRIAGAARLDRLPVDLAFSSQIDAAGAGKPAKVVAQVRLDQAFLDAFAIALPSGMVGGSAPATATLELARGQAPKFQLESDLAGVTLRLDAIGYRKPAAASGRLEVTGTAGTPAAIDHIAVRAPGLEASGRIELTAENGLARARFDRVRVGDWLDAPVTLTGRGGAAPAVTISGGKLDFRNMPATGGTGGSGTGPLSVSLDRFIIADGVDLTGFHGEFATAGGLSGSFTARLNGGVELTGTLVPQRGGTAVRVMSANGGAVLRDAGMAERIRGGTMELRLTPTGQPGIYDGVLAAERLRVRGTPLLAELLNSLSVVGLLQQLNGDGIVFDHAQAQFRLAPGVIDIQRASAVGASMGISAQGRYLPKSGAIDLQGVFSPVFLLNGIGQALTREGEGVFGVNYRVSGTVAAPKVAVNPLSVLAPGMLREIFRAPSPRAR